MDRKILKVVCGFSNEKSASIREKLEEAAAKKNLELSFVSRYRKEGVLQYLQEHEDYNIVVLQEILQNSSPYTAEDLAELEDIRNLNIIVSLSKGHYSDRYMRILYAAGITNALYEEDASADNIVELMLHGRNRKSCREYYGIRTLNDVEQTLNIVDQDRLDKYSDYIINGGTIEETPNRYKFSAERLNSAENIELVKQLPEYFQTVLSDIQQYQLYSELARGKKRWLRKKKDTHWKRKKFEPDLYESAAPVEEQQISQTEENHKSSEPVSEENINTTGQGYGRSLNPEAEDLLEEDISDLLGFQNITEPKRLKKSDGTEIKKTVREPDLRVNQRKIPPPKEGAEKKSKKPFLIIVVLAVIFLFLVIGIMILGPNRHRESEPPVIRHGSDLQDTGAADTKDLKQNTKKQANIQKPGKKTNQPEDVPEKNEETDSSAEKTEEPQTQKEQTSQRENQAQPAPELTQVNQPAEPPVSQVEVPQPAADAGRSDVEVNTSVETVEPPAPSTPQPSVTTDYSGKIFTGGEVAQIAVTAEAGGKSIYLRTRTDGEGYYTAAEVAGLVDGTCSYLAQDSGGQITFIEQ